MRQDGSSTNVDEHDDAKLTHPQEKKSTTQVKIGSTGRKNCRVMGITRDVMSKVAISVLVAGPGRSMTQREKMPRMTKIMYCPS